MKQPYFGSDTGPVTATTLVNLFAAGLTDEQIISAKVYIPFCGSGEIVRKLVEKKLAAGARSEDIIRSIFASDIDLGWTEFTESVVDNLIDGQTTPLYVACGDFKTLPLPAPHIDAVIMDPMFLNKAPHLRGAVGVYGDYIQHAYNMNVDRVITTAPARWYVGGRRNAKFQSWLLTGKVDLVIDVPDESTELLDGPHIVGGSCIMVLSTPLQNPLIVNVKDNKIVNKMRRPLFASKGVFIRNNNIFASLDTIHHLKSLGHVIDRVTPQDVFKVGQKLALVPKEGEVSVTCHSTLKNSSFGAFDKQWQCEDQSLFNTHNIFLTRMGYYSGLIDNAVVGNVGDICTAKVLCIKGFKSREKTEKLLEYLQSDHAKQIVSTLQTSLILKKEMFSFLHLPQELLEGG